MGIFDDFYFLAWDEMREKGGVVEAQNIAFSYIFDEEKKKDFTECCALIFSCNKKNYDKFLQIPIFQFLLQNFCKKELDVRVLQEVLFFLIKERHELFDDIVKGVKKLRSERIIRNEEHEHIANLFYQMQSSKKVQTPNIVQKKREKRKKEPQNYKEYVEFFKSQCKDLDAILELEYLKKQLWILQNKLLKASFSIGVTGIINAGKSTMLNALLSKELLGTSVVPETANLTIIRYAKKPYAKVNFWTKSQWRRIEKNAEHSPGIQKFLKETQAVFKEDLYDFITDEGRAQTIGIDELSLFTSAKESNLVCNLIKSVELYTDLNFVKDGVSIVDTPGLDDPVVQREEITKEYLSSCDVMVHLMNANQSATKKDVDFIIDSLIYGNITRLLVVITRIDTVTKKELEEVITYTKNSIHKRLKQINKEAKFDAIISKVDFLPIAGKMALLHRIGQEKEAILAGYSIEKSGILDIENYLEELLFGANSQKATLLMDGAKKGIISIANEALDSFQAQKQNLQKSATELQKEYNKKQLQNAHNNNEITKIRDAIACGEHSLDEYFTTLSNFVKMRFGKLKEIVLQRIFDDVSYEMRKYKKKPSSLRIETMIKTTMQDGIVDIARDYRHEFQKQVEREVTKIGQVSSILELVGHDEVKFSAKEFFEEHFGQTFLHGSYDIVNVRVNSAIKSTKKEKLEMLNIKLDTIFQDTMENVSEQFFAHIEKVNSALLDSFVLRMKNPVDTFEAKVQEEQLSLLSQVDLLQNDETKAKKRLQEISDKIEWLEVFNAKE